MTPSTFTRLATALAIGSAVLASSGAAFAGGHGGYGGRGGVPTGGSPAFSGALNPGVFGSIQTYSVTPVRDHRGQPSVMAPPTPCYTVVCGPGTYNASHRRSPWPGTVRDHR